MAKLIPGCIGLCLAASLLLAQTAVQTKVNPKDQQQYVWIPAGTFTMGCSPSDHNCAADESPAHSVEITKGFWIGQTPVTVSAWKIYRAAAGKPALPALDEFGRKLNEAAADDKQPVVEATWDDGSGYCGWAGMRLPSEAEWEYAARAGTNTETYAWLADVAWYADNSGRKPMISEALSHEDLTKYPKRLFSNGNGPHDVKQKKPNAWGLYDMLGNVWEWVADYYAPDYYNSKVAVNPPGPAKGSQRVLRGGAWDSVPSSVRASYRRTNPPGDRVNDFGFRCVGDLP
jgi:formylglycine-generating enzyme required for sulfatase activity